MTVGPTFPLGLWLRTALSGLPFPGAGDFDNTGGGSSDVGLESDGSFGTVDGQFFTVSLWLRRDAPYGGNQMMMFGASGAGAMELRFNPGDDLEFLWSRSTDSLRLINVQSSNAGNITDSNWHHWMAAGRMDTAALNDSWDDTDAAMPGTVATGTLDMTFSGGLHIASQAGTQAWDGCLGEIWFHMGTTSASFLDPTVEANRRKFIDASGNAVPLGADGELPLGFQPLLYLPGRGAAMAANVGSGGDFIVETGKALPADCPSLPPAA